MKRVLVLSYYYPPDIGAGSFRTEALVQSLLKSDDVYVQVVSSEPVRYSGYQPTLGDAEINDARLSVTRIPSVKHGGGFLGQSISFSVFAWRVLKFCSKSHYDIVFATSSRLMTAVLGAFLSPRLGAKLYLDIRDIFVETVQGVYPCKVFQSIVKCFSWLEGFALKRAEKVNLVSAGFLSYFNSRYRSHEFSLFTNGIDDMFVPLSVAELQSSPRDKVRILYAGNVGDGQGLHRILPDLAAKLGAGYEIIVLGAGARLAELKESIAALGVDNIQLLAPVDRVQLLEYYRLADVLFLHLNDIAAFERVLPSKLFEYAASGKPILAGVSGYAAEFILEEISNSAIFPPCNAEAAAKAILT
ncbi:MAG TPA: glycosyltransferase WbuB, partial [Chromatiaceae bacterium]|nr:glycosyltransferase WbuB [Chromatiaceae bacterium]